MLNEKQMRLLIVDDQTSVVQGLVCGIDWNALGITRVFEAYNAFEAREVLAKENIDILLCDIEMPAQSGLDLLHWVRGVNIELECIFLTAHADFEYARQALAMQSFDYIVQPAPYREIEAAVARASEKVRKRRETTSVFEYGRVISENDYRLSGQIFNDFLEKNIDEQQYDNYASLGEVPGRQQAGCLAAFQILSWEKDVTAFNQTFLEGILENVIGEMFAPFAQKIVLYGLSRDRFVFVTYGRDAYVMDDGAVRRQLFKTLEKFEEVLKLTAAFYFKATETVSEMPETRKSLIKAMGRNVIRKKGVFGIDDLGAPRESADAGAGFGKWTAMLSRGMVDAARKDIMEYLDFYVGSGKLDDEFLWKFYSEFNRMFYAASDDAAIHLYDIFSGADDARIYSQAYTSVSHMKQYIDRVMDYLKESLASGTEQESHIELVKRYIHENLDKDIHREDIARQVHLNEDYLSRVFKKKMGTSLKEYIVTEKISVAQQMIRTTALPISFIALKIGYSNYSHFSKTYKKVTGISPTEERKEERSESEY